MQTSAASLVGTHGGLGAMSEGHAETRPLTPRTPHSARERAYVASKDGGKGGVGSRMSVGSSELLCEDVIVGGCHVDAALLESGLSLQSRDGGCARFFFSRARPVHVFIPAAELIAARLGDGPESSCHALIYHLSTPASDPNAWSCGFVTLVCSSPDAAQRWVDEVSALCSRQPDRPRTVQVYVNPHGGRRTAPMIWERKCKPILELASVRFRVLITKAANHAKLHMETMSEEDAAAIDGVLVVGGDGLFQEALTGLINMRRRSPKLDAAGRRLRMGHIPGGSTDATAYSMYGTRSAEAATLHCVLGDRMALDVVHVAAELPDGRMRQRYCICLLSYGFMGDVMRFSERFRCMGPARYDFAGLVKFLRSKNYPTRVAFRVPDELVGEVPCSTACTVCSKDVAPTIGDAPCVASTSLATPRTKASTPTDNADPGEVMPRVLFPASSTPRANACFSLLDEAARERAAAGGEEGSARGAVRGGCRSPLRKRGGLCAWGKRKGEEGPDGSGLGQVRVLEGRFKSVMVANLPCRSDKSKKGLMPTTHLADGRLKLLVIRDVNFVRHMHYMARMAAKGVTRPRGKLELEEATEVEVEAIGDGPLSSWNVDGEIVIAKRLRAQVMSGLVQVFSRGLDAGSDMTRTMAAAPSAILGARGRGPGRRGAAYSPQRYLDGGKTAWTSPAKLVLN